MAAACGGDDAAPKGTYGEVCAAATDCEEGLNCLSRICTVACSGGDEAPCKAQSTTGGCVGGVCYDICTDTSQCEGELECVFTTDKGTCRPNN